MKKLIVVILALVVFVSVFFTMRKTGIFTPYVNWSKPLLGDMLPSIKPGYLYIAKLYDTYQVKVQGINFDGIAETHDLTSLKNIKNIEIFLPQDENIKILSTRGDMYIKENIIDSEILVAATNSKPNIKNENISFWFFKFDDTYDYNNFYRYFSLYYTDTIDNIEIEHRLINTEEYEGIINSKVGNVSVSELRHKITYTEKLTQGTDFNERYIMSSEFDKEAYPTTHRSWDNGCAELYEFTKLEESINVIGMGYGIYDFNELKDTTDELTYYMRKITIRKYNDGVQSRAMNNENGKKIISEQTRNKLIEISENLEKYN